MLLCGGYYDTVIAAVSDIA